MEAEDYAVSGLHFASGAIGSLTASTATYPGGKEMIRLHGKYGSLHLARESMNIHWRDGRSKYFESNSLNKRAVVAKSEWHRRVIQDFLNYVENDREPLVTGAEALGVHQLIDAVDRSSRNGSVVKL